MKTQKQIANEILPASLNETQIDRAIKSAAEDAQHWKIEAQSGTLPKVEEMHLDWNIDPDLIDAGVDGYVMQRLSFAFAEAQQPLEKMKTQDLYNITLAAADTKASEQIQVGFLLIRNMGYGKKEIANEITDLRQAVRVMRAGMTDSESDRLESIRLERTGVEYDAEQGTIAEEFSETVGDLVDVLNMGDYQCSLSAK